MFTLHCMPSPANLRLLQYYRHVPVVAVSEMQRHLITEVGFEAVVPHGLDPAKFPETNGDGPRGYVVFLGRIRPEKGVDLAVAAAREARVPLKIAGRVKPDDRDYFASEIQPHLDGRMVQYLGELGFAEKTRLLAGAAVCIVPSRIDEPFGLVAVEAGMCGTPVVALGRGALPEVVVPGVTGIVCRNPSELPAALREAESLDRQRCRQSAATRFSEAAMVDAYERLFYRIAQHMNEVKS
jgi:glycosyltransferase involved in cell wall biosynthesis